MFGSSFLISWILKFISGKGLEWLKNLSNDHKAEAKSYIFSLIPGDAFDELVWNVIEKVWDSILVAAEQLINSLIEGQSLSGEAKAMHEEKALAQAVLMVQPAAKSAM